MNTYYIYKIQNNINGMIYIGQHIYHKNEALYKYMGKGVLIKEAIKTYKKENFTKEILEFIEDDEKREKVSKREQYWINKYNSLYPNGYNLDEGGIGGCSQETAKKVIETRKKNNTLKHSEETKQKISNSNRGKEKSEIHKQHLKDNHKSRKEYTIIFEDGHSETLITNLKSICEKYNVTSNKLLSYSIKHKFLNGIYLKDITNDMYVRFTDMKETYCKDPIKGDICKFSTLHSRKYRNLELYKEVNLKNCIIKEN